jgi:hypothetical protein
VHEGERLQAATRIALARAVVRHRLLAADPLAPGGEPDPGILHDPAPQRAA